MGTYPTRGRVRAASLVVLALTAAVVLTLVLFGPRHSPYGPPAPTGSRSRAAGRRSTCRLWTMNADGSNPQPVTTGPDDKYSPTWSPDGTQIAFTRAGLGGDSQIWAVNANGSNARALTTDGENVTPDWSPVADRLPSPAAARR